MILRDSIYSEETICNELSSMFGGKAWKWDGRFGCVLIEFPVDAQDSIRTVLERYLDTVWNISNIDTAPDAVQTINDHLGGLMAGQLLFTSDPGRDDLMYCAWWPWGNGETVSIRVAPVYGKLTEPQRAERINLFKDRFGV
jgi:hypothetical protein